MVLIKALYQFAERTWFQTLRRKLLGCTVPIFGLLLVLAWSLRQAASAGPGGRGTPGGAGTLAWAVPILALALGGGAMALFLASVEAPLRRITRFFQESDLSQDLRLDSHDEIRGLADGYNRFAGEIRDTLNDSKRLGLSIAVGSTRTLKLASDSAQDARSQGQRSERIALTSQEVAESVAGIAEVTRQISRSTLENLESARGTRLDLAEADSAMAAANQRLLAFAEQMAGMNQKSERMADVAQLIEGISNQTQLLALNATIEAAHAGVAGQGFAVVADEVRKLSDRVREAAREISQNLEGMLQDMASTGQGILDLTRDFQGTSAILDRASAHFGKLVLEFEQNTTQLTGATQAVAGISGTTEAIHLQACDIQDLSREAEQRLEQAIGCSSEMNRSTEKLLERVSRFRTGQSELEAVLLRILHWRDLITTRLQVLADQGCELFDRSYRPVAGTNPQKFLTSYTASLTGELQGLFDQARKDLGSTYAVLVDVNGYLPCHHTDVSAAMTGDPAADLLKSRHQRIYFNLDAEKRRALNTESFLLQTYMRDTGEILNDLSMPILLQGRHWGALVTGFRPERFLQEPDRRA